MPREKCCRRCPQEDCGMSSEPMTWEQINNIPPPGDEPEYPLACYFLNCGNLASAVEVIVSKPELFEGNDLVPVETYAKPHISESRPHGITGKFVDRWSNVYVIRNGQRIFLSNPAVNTPPRILELI